MIVKDSDFGMINTRPSDSGMVTVDEDAKKLDKLLSGIIESCKAMICVVLWQPARVHKVIFGGFLIVLLQLMLSSCQGACVYLNLNFNIKSRPPLKLTDFLAAPK
ncbi:hypothetical protein Ancab_006335 [Ancistrocladus abbreviatus]